MTESLQLCLTTNNLQVTVTIALQEFLYYEPILFKLCTFLFLADNGTMTFEYKTMSGVSPDETGRLIISEEDESKLPMILGAVFGFLLIVLIIGAILFRRHLAQQAKVSHEDVRGNYPMKTNCVQNSQYEGPPVARPRTPGNAAPLETKHSAGNIINLRVC